VADFPNPPGLGTGIRAEQESMDIQVGDIAGRWLPLPYPAESVDGLEGAWYWERTGLSARSPSAGVRGQQYTVTFLDVEPTLEDVSVAVPHADADIATLVLPARMPEVIAETAQAVAGQYSTTYERAMALQDYFTSGEFEYSEDAPVDGGFDGTGADIIAEFLDKKTGYCVHFASAMAIMARTLGIPARVAVGFQPGESQTAAGITSYTVTSHDLHAWPELYFDGVGWLRFEPTPGRGILPDYSTPAVVDDPTTPQNEASPTAAPTSNATANPERPDQGQVDPGLAADGSPTANPLPVVLAVLAGLIILAGFAPLITRTMLRRRRESAVRHGRDPAAAAWAELRDTARDYGWAAPDSETPRDFADRLAVVLSDQREQIADFRSDVEESAFAPPGRGVPTVQELRAIRRSIAGTVDRRDRLRAIFLPDSLVTRFRYDPEA
jgi:transglutaminase-like putative cysteine protease